MVATRHFPVLLGAAGLVGTVGAGLWWRRRRATQEALGQWAVVTVLHPRAEVGDSGPLQRLAGRAGELRTGLRDLEQTFEAGQVPRATWRPEGRRPPTPGGVVIDLADRRAQGKSADTR